MVNLQLYMLQEIKSDNINITTVEILIEYQIPVLIRYKVHDAIGLSFYAVLEIYLKTRSGCTFNW